MDSALVVISGSIFGLAVYAICRAGVGPTRSARWIWGGAAYFILAVTTAPSLWRGLALGYEGDSFHTLSVPGRTGLALLSLILAIGLASLAVGKTMLLYRSIESWPLPGFLTIVVLDGLANLSLFWLFLWLSPQLYYTYYLILFDSLVWQWVVKAPPGPGVVFDVIAMPRSGNLSGHGLGLLGRALLLLSITAPALRGAAALTGHGGPIEAAALPRFAFTLAVIGALCQTVLGALLPG